METRVSVGLQEREREDVARPGREERRVVAIPRQQLVGAFLGRAPEQRAWPIHTYTVTVGVSRAPAPVYVILDNLSATQTPAIRTRAKRHKVEVCPTPTSAG